jgi:hypothetical protein
MSKELLELAGLRERLFRLRDSQGIPDALGRVEVCAVALCDALLAAHEAADLIGAVENVDYWEGSGDALIDWLRDKARAQKGSA